MNRFTTVIIACVLLIVFLPAMALVAGAILVRMGRPVLFAQDRPGKDGQLFRLIKFRTMRNQVDADGTPLADAARLTRLGTFLRRTSLDELPEIWNVVRGDMNLVGPRPLLVEYLPLYSDRQKRRHEVRPGITGWAQVNGRNNLSWDERFELDVWYVDNRSTWLDLKILAMTVATVIGAKDVNQTGHATAEKFKGGD
ncbi:MAG: sugar transferase [Gammaproteobacteria bacterium]|nr:sugar transferase [Gammaproteobacteria bacterium]